MQMRIETSTSGKRRAVTSGLTAMGQAELALELTASVPDEAAERVLRYVTDYITASRQHILAGETMRYGWSTLRFAPTASSEIINIEELASPFAPDAESYITGAAQAIGILGAQDDTVRRNGVASPAHHPHRSELAVICRRLRPNPPPKVMVFDRLKATRQDDSGWFVGCGNPAHDHNDFGELSRLHLVYIATLNPKVVYYLAMPEETRVVFDHGQVIVFAPSEQDGRVDEGQSG